jgi:hypothetical protein
MSIEFTSIEMIQKEFNLEEDSHESIRSVLKHIKSTLHPDKTGGKFQSENDEVEYHKLDRAINFIDSNKVSGKDLVTISAVTDLTKAVTELVSSQSEVTNKNTELSNEINRSIVSYHSKLKMPRIALTAVTVALSATWLFPSAVEKHPILSNIIDFTSFSVNFIWAYAVMFCVLFWIKTWRSEELTKANRESLKTESIQNRLFLGFIKQNKSEDFVLEDLVDFLMYQNGRYRHPIKILFGSVQNIDLPLANVTAEVIIDRAIKRKAVIASKQGSISQVYRVVAANKPIKQD